MTRNEDPSLKENVPMAENDNENDAEMTRHVQANGYEVVCRTSPYNICYRLDALGNVVPLQRKRPIRAIRVYF